MFLVMATLGDALAPLLLSRAMALWGPEAFPQAVLVAAVLLLALYMLVDCLMNRQRTGMALLPQTMGTEDSTHDPDRIPAV